MSAPQRLSRRRLGRAGLAAVCASVAAVLSAALTSAAGASAASAGPRLSASAAILVAPQTHQQLFGLRPDAEVPIASTTKLMTALLTLEHARLGQMFTEPDYYPAAADSQIGLVPGERMTVHDLLLALLLPSADDAAEDLAYNVGHGSVATFIAMMNAKARELGLSHTHYSTPIGLDTPGNYSSASDLVTLTAWLLRTEPFFRHAVALEAAVLRSGSHSRYVVNRNDLVARFPWIDGVKTGHTNDAGYVLVASARRHGMRLLSAVLGTSSEAARDENTLALLDYGFASFRPATAIRRGELIARPAVKDQPGRRAEVIAASSVRRIVPRGARFTTRLRLPRELSGPMRKGVFVGTATVLLDGRPVAVTRLVLARSIPALSTLTQAGRLITQPSALLSLSVLALAAAALAVRRRMRHVSIRRGGG